MIHSKKMVVVPYIPPIPDPEESKILELDNEMTQILQNKTISLDLKLQRYNMVLVKFLSLYKPNSMLTSVYSQMHDQVQNQPTTNVEPKLEIKEEIDHKPYSFPSVVMPLSDLASDKKELVHNPDFSFQPFPSPSIDKSIKKKTHNLAPYTVPKVNRVRLDQNDSFLELKTKPNSPFNFDNFVKKDNSNNHNALLKSVKKKENINDSVQEPLDEHMEIETIPNPPPLTPRIFNRNSNVGYEKFLKKIKTTRKNASIKSIAAKVKSSIRDHEFNRKLINHKNNNLMWQNLNSMYSEHPLERKRPLTQMDDSLIGPLTRGLKKIRE
jgi:hypothetical protein